MRRNWLASATPRLAANRLAGGTAKARMPRIPLAIPIPAERPATRSLGALEPLRTPLFLVVTGGSFWAALGHRDPHRDWWSGFATGLVSSTYQQHLFDDRPQLRRAPDRPRCSCRLHGTGGNLAGNRDHPGQAKQDCYRQRHHDAPDRRSGLGHALLRRGRRQAPAAHRGKAGGPLCPLGGADLVHRILRDPAVAPAAGAAKRTLLDGTLSPSYLGTVYVEYPWIREAVTGRASRRSVASRMVAAVLAGGAGLLGVLAAQGRSDHEVT